MESHGIRSATVALDDQPGKSEPSQVPAPAQPLVPAAGSCLPRTSSANSAHSSRLPLRVFIGPLVSTVQAPASLPALLPAATIVERRPRPIANLPPQVVSNHPLAGAAEDVRMASPSFNNSPPAPGSEPICQAPAQTRRVAESGGLSDNLCCQFYISNLGSCHIIIKYPQQQLPKGLGSCLTALSEPEKIVWVSLPLHELGQLPTGMVGKHLSLKNEAKKLARPAWGLEKFPRFFKNVKLPKIIQIHSNSFHCLFC